MAAVEPSSSTAYSTFSDPQKVVAGGLTLVWTSPPISTPAEPSDDHPPHKSIDIDAVLIDGVYHNWDDCTQGNPSSGTGSWVNDYMQSLNSDCRILQFTYNPSQIIAGRRNREAIRKQALSLLNGLVKLRENEPKKRLIMFIAHDIGGIIVKDALVAASLNQASWSEIFDYSRLQIFCGCPQRSIDTFEMEDKLARYLFATHNLITTKIRPNVTSIPGLAAAIFEINGLFLESKVYLRSYLISTYIMDSSSAGINQVFDNYTGVLGIPTEKRIALESGNKMYLDLLKYLREIENYFVPEARLIQYERILLSLASPLHLFKTAHQINHWITENATYQEWLKQPGFQILYVQDTNGVSKVAEQIFYSLEAQNSDDLVLYFSFDRYDVRCNSIKNMLSTFLAQIICRSTTYQLKWVEIFFESLNQDHGWTELDLVFWFEFFRFKVPNHGVQLVLNDFDECTETSRNSFLKYVSYVARESEVPWRVAVTSRKPRALLDELSRWPCIDLDVAASEAALQSSRDVEMDIARLIQHRPDLSGLEELLRRELQSLTNFDPLARYIICEQARFHKDWPEEVSIQHLFDNGWDDCSLESVLDQSLRNIPDQGAIRRLLSWLLYCVRPLTIWELATVMFIGTTKDKENEAFPSPSVVKDLISNMEVWLAGIIVIQENEVKIRNPRLRGIFMAPEPEDGHRFLWNELKATAHFDISKLCLEYISRASVQRIIEEEYRVPESESIEASPFPDRKNLCSYVVQAWTHHLPLASPDLSLLKLVEDLIKSGIMKCWWKSYHALSNPITRSNGYFESLFSAFIRLGLPNVVEPQDNKDFSLGLCAAAASGRASTVRDLLERTEHSKFTLLDALTSAASSGEEQMMLDLIDQILVKAGSGFVDWPPNLLYRAAWLGLDRLSKRLLELGVPADSDVELQAKTRTTPLYLAARHGHLSTVRVLVGHKANANFRSLYNLSEQTPLRVAAIWGHEEVVKILVEEAGAELEWKNAEETTSLYSASMYGNFNVVEMLLYLGADPNMGITGESTSQGWSPLVAAADDGYLKCVRALLEGGANPNVSGPDGIDTPLRYAGVNGHLEVCRLLLMKGADANNPLIKPPILIEVIKHSVLSKSKKLELVKLLVEYHALVNATDEDGTTAIICAVENDDKPLVRFLLDYEADIVLAGKGGRSPLHLAVENQKEDLVELLLQKGADPNCRTSEGVTPLHTAHPSVNITRLLLERNADPDVCIREGFTELMYVSSNGHTDCVRLLLEHNAAVDAEINQDSSKWAGWTAVSFASYFGYADIVRLLGEAGANLKHKTKTSGSPLHLAVDGNSLHALVEFRQRINLDQVEDNGGTALHLLDALDVPLANIKLLVNGGANLNIQDKIGSTPLTIAASCDKRDVVSFLLKQDLDINVGSGYRGAALHQASRKSNIGVVKMLVEHGADVNLTVPGIAGSPLQSTCLQYDDNQNNYSEEIVRYLLKKGANLNAQGGGFGSAISAAALCSMPNIINLLLEKGATIDVRDTMGRLPIHLAAFHGIDSFQLIYDAGGNIRSSDKMRRTALHCAALPGRAKVVGLILSLLPPEVVDEPDIDGWTPLCWAARGTSNWVSSLEDIEEEDQINVIKLLLKHGADRFVRVLNGKQKQLPWMIAQYCGADAEVISLLKQGLEGESGDDPDNADTTAGDDHSVNQGEACKRDFYCDGCLWYIRGLMYKCRMCIEFAFCSKCYTWCDILHADHPGHTFDEVGPEFETIPISLSIRDDDITSSVSSLSSDSEYETDSQSETNADGDGDEPKVNGSLSESQDMSRNEDS